MWSHPLETGAGTGEEEGRGNWTKPKILRSLRFDESQDLTKPKILQKLRFGETQDLTKPKI